MNNIVYVDANGIKQFEMLLDDVNRRIDLNNKEKSEAMLDAPGDGWHDNFAAEDAARIERMLLDEKKKLLLDKPYLRVVPSTNRRYKLELIYSNDDVEVIDIKLTGNYRSLNDDEVTLNSPLGNAINNKNTIENFSYEVNGIIVKGKILN